MNWSEGSIRSGAAIALNAEERSRRTMGSQTSAPTAEQEWTVNDMRLIDADALKEKLRKERDAIPLTYTERYGFGVEFPSGFGQARRGGVKTALRCMEQTPTIDAVPVVRCKDCRFVEKSDDESIYLCLRKMLGMIRSDDFCSYGKRKDGDTDG